MSTEITGEFIKSAIAQRIVENFTDDSNARPVIYKEQILQGFKKPSFFIWTINVTQSKQMNNNYTRSYQMNVRYHAVEGRTDLYEHLCSVGSKLLEALATITLPTVKTFTDGTQTEVQLPVNGQDMDFKITDNVLQLFATYNIRTKQQTSTSSPMSIAEVDVKSY